jgi:glycosyltransferase involved in cell wall biosynthesis
MKIAFVPNAFVPDFGGVVTATDEVASELARLGHEVIVVAHRRNRRLPVRERRNGFEIIRIRLSTGRWYLRPIVGLVALLRMWWVFRRWRPTLVHVQFVHINALYPALLSWLLPFALVIRFGGNDIHKFPVESRLLRSVMKLSMLRAQQVQFNSASLMQDAAPYLRWVRGDLTIVGDGARPDEWLGAESRLTEQNRPYVFTMGRLVHKKGFDLLIQAFAHVSRDRLGLQLSIAGDGEEMAALVELRDSLGLEDRVHLLGHVDRLTLGRLLKGAVLFVLPSRIEPVGIVTIEAMMEGKPVLATSVGGVPDVVKHGQSGWLVQPSVEGLTNGMNELLASPDLMAELGRAGRDVALSSFTWRGITQDYLTAYRRILPTLDA